MSVNGAVGFHSSKRLLLGPWIDLLNSYHVASSHWMSQFSHLGEPPRRGTCTNKCEHCHYLVSVAKKGNNNKCDILTIQWRLYCTLYQLNRYSDTGRPMTNLAVYHNPKIRRKVHVVRKDIFPSTETGFSGHTQIAAWVFIGKNPKSSQVANMTCDDQNVQEFGFKPITC